MADATEKKRSAATIVKVVVLVGVIAMILSLWLHGQKLGREYARRFDIPQEKAAVLLPWHWDSSQWKSWLTDAGTAEVTSGR